MGNPRNRTRKVSRKGKRCKGNESLAKRQRVEGEYSAQATPEVDGGGEPDGPNPSSADGHALSTPLTSRTSASARKLGERFSGQAKKVDSQGGFILLDLAKLKGICYVLCCPECKTSGLTLMEDFGKKKGLSIKFILECSSCFWEMEFDSSSTANIPGKSRNNMEVNVRMVMAMREIGVGYEGLNMFAINMNMHRPMTKNNYNKIIHSLHESFMNVASEDKAIEYALLKAKAVLEDECEADDTLKWNSVIADGIIMSNERDGERDIRTKIADSLRRKFPLFGGDDFDFIKVRHKRISQPELQASSEFNYMVVKKLAGQGMLYIRVRPGRSFFVDDADEEQEDDDDLLKPYYDESKDKEQTANKDESESTIHVIDLVEEGVGKEIEEVQRKALERPLPVYNIQPLIEEATKEALINPVEVIRFFQKKLQRGRDLHILDASVISTGETNYISVDRSRLLETTIAELKYVKDFRLTFEVDFMGELAQDMGGPRLEWIELVNKEMQTKYFEHGLREHLSDEYYYVGIMCCIALLQNGQIPRIFPSEVLDQLFDATAVITSPCIQQLQKGLQELGLLDVFCSFPIIRHIFQPVSQPLAAKRVIQLLQPQFSCEGSNAFMRKKRSICFVHQIYP